MAVLYACLYPQTVHVDLDMAKGKYIEVIVPLLRKIAPSEQLIFVFISDYITHYSYFWADHTYHVIIIWFTICVKLSSVATAYNVSWKF